jgi:hypothetical protein
VSRAVTQAALVLEITARHRGTVSWSTGNFPGGHAASEVTQAWPGTNGYHLALADIPDPERPA